MIENIINGSGALFTLDTILFMLLGVFLGIIFGAIPGLGVMLAIVIFLPMTFGVNPIAGILMLLGIYCGGTYGGSISAILINTPGTPSSAATLLDGFPLSQQGKSKKALLMALYASVIAGVISAMLLLVAAPQLAKITMFFGPAEYFMLAVFGLSIIASVSGDNVFRGLIAGCLGVFISTIGMDTASGVFRFTFGNINLAGGITLVPALIGLFAFSEILAKINDKDNSVSGKQMAFTGEGLKGSELTRSMGTIFRSSIVGTIIGIIPGTGGGIASFISHDMAKRKSKNPENYGKGELDGVAAAEAGNNGVTGATLIPLLTLGIPGDGAAAVLLGAFMLNGLLPGTSLFTEHATTIYAVMVGLIVVNIIMLLQGRLLINFFAKIANVPVTILIPFLILTCTAGAFAETTSVFSVYIAVVFGIFAYFLIKLGFSPVPLLLGIILGPIAESNLGRALIISEGSLAIFVTRPISAAFILLTLLSIFLAVHAARKDKKLKKS
ncbi:tripartite tricarboxylate transporter permease [Paenibacillus sp.]|uniref:tripartite tricarboxylate transporter permease n=1 Tax=Paenibacillus sp. TaxID=58172 RepID=UPI002D6B4C14|nr:tripartite tricarboxylate transporter permease [Paenibacillus sp.]HZG85410.1 tripartite tricarboxylate transporter permease [Paenibacillus sp.]